VNRALVTKALWPLLGLVFVAWLVMPVTMRHDFAQDAGAFVTAGRLYPEHEGDIYGVDSRPTARFTRTECHDGPNAHDCLEHSVPFVSPPQLLPLLEPIGWLPIWAGVGLLRFIAAVGLVAGVTLVWWRARPTTAIGLFAAVMGTVALTPLVHDTLFAGQPTGLMLVSVMLPVATGRRGERVIAWASLLVIGLFKLFPLLLFAAPRRRGALVGAVGAVVALTLAVVLRGDFGLLHRFLEASRDTGQLATSTNLSLDGLIGRFDHGWSTSSPWYVVGLAARVVALGWIYVRFVRRSDPRLRWAWLWAAVLVVSPIVWSFYLVSVWGVVAVSVLSPGINKRFSRPDMALVAIALAAALTLPISRLPSGVTINLGTDIAIIGALGLATVAAAIAARTSDEAARRGGSTRWVAAHER
jgi:hypothetical protein